MKYVSQNQIDIIVSDLLKFFVEIRRKKKSNTRSIGVNASVIVRLKVLNKSMRRCRHNSDVPILN